jgi:hypothetical protein
MRVRLVLGGARFEMIAVEPPIDGAPDPFFPLQINRGIDFPQRLKNIPDGFLRIHKGLGNVPVPAGKDRVVKLVKGSMGGVVGPDGKGVAGEPPDAIPLGTPSQPHLFSEMVLDVIRRGSGNQNLTSEPA